MVSIAIVGRRKDAEVKALSAALKAANIQSLLIDFSGFPRHTLATYDGKLVVDDLLQDGQLALAQADLVILRTLCFDHFEPAPQTSAATVTRFHRYQVARLAAQHGALLNLRVPVVNSPHSFLFHRLKAHQYELLAKNGIPVPRTLATTDVSVARSFARSFAKGVVAKPLTSGAEVVMADEAFFEQYGSEILRRPFLIQQYVKGRALRAYLLGGQLISMSEIIYDRRYVDWRERTQRLLAFAPEQALLAQMQRAVRLLDLPYCALDVEWDEATSQYYLLDFNPSGLFVGYSRLAGCNVASHIVRYALEVIESGGKVWKF